jgi:hypothetical protein
MSIQYVWVKPLQPGACRRCIGNPLALRVLDRQQARAPGDRAQAVVGIARGQEGFDDHRRFLGADCWMESETCAGAAAAVPPAATGRPFTPPALVDRGDC